MTRFFVLAGLLWIAPSVLAHGEGAIPSDLLTHWSLNPLILTGILLPVSLYVQGARQRVTIWRAACFLSGMALLFVALISPVDALGASLFSGHMIQHLMLVLGAAPLIALSQPLPALLRGLPRRWSQRFGRLMQTPLIQRLGQWSSNPLTISLLHIAALWIWHLPSLYSAAVQYEAIHALEHASFFLTALLYWDMVCRTSNYGSRVLSVFIVMMTTGVLGALMTFARVPWYSDHAAYVDAWGLTLLEDQQLAGLLMWIPSGILYVIVAVVLLGIWINVVEERVSKRDHRLVKDMSDA